ncbi:hypothetical protein [Demequina litorisediminis]|uniref:hypothetical protein n=1 Tax=Demequina litorisediminis TaxID=1849022 RepID=UPI0024E15711|nr:hypothetical protein [Demequina litorisediminis]
MRYSLTLTDPDNTADYDRDDPTPVTITWVHPTDPSKNYTVDVALGSGYVLWPGAAVEPAEGYTEDQIDPTNPDTFVPTDWPGWGVDENGDWFEYDDPEVDYGWTRDGVEVTAEINPTFSVSLTYPPPTATCTAEPPTTTTVVLDAPPPTAARVEDITYTG